MSLYLSDSDEEDLLKLVRGLSVKEEPVKEKPIVKNPKLLSDLLETLGSPDYVTWKPEDYTDAVCKLVALEPSCFEYSLVKCMFDGRMRKSYTVDTIKRVENPYLFAQFALKKLQKEVKYTGLQEMELFHGDAK
ncbi:hypothetical protein NQ318_003996 [Aromia moschata]|uniref:PARP catalytic domain-containing protein n=1 Tax=Aromia moschata TaxID=1265417 RepID=A0AAV8Z9F8_9CUCU|nr:hypothetical protein NQ318_003996 [Aromia moschata]